MDQQPARTSVTPLTTRIVRHVALMGAPLFLLGGTILWPDVDRPTLSLTALGLLFLGLLTFIDRSVKLRHRKNLVIVAPIAIFVVIIAGFFYWRAGTIVAAASFNPGIAPFDITVREVPVPVTRSHHFIITLKRGQYPVTSFRYFWVSYTPKSVRIEWPRLETFKVIFDERYIAKCEWSWGREATWTLEAPAGTQLPGDQP
jgi:hypothetical protein